MLWVTLIAIICFIVYKCTTETKYENEARQKAIKEGRDTYSFEDLMGNNITLDTKTKRIITDTKDIYTGDTIRKVGGKTINLSQQERTKRYLNAKKYNPKNRTACLYQREEERGYWDNEKRGRGDIYADLLGEKGDLYFIRDFVIGEVHNHMPNEYGVSFYMRLKDGHLARVADPFLEYNKEEYEAKKEIINNFIIEFNKQQDQNIINNKNDKYFVEKFYCNKNNRKHYQGYPDEFIQQYNYGR